MSSPLQISNKHSSFLARGLKKELQAAGIDVNHSQLLEALARVHYYDSARAMRAMNVDGPDPRPSVDPAKAKLFRTTFLVTVLSEDQSVDDLEIGNNLVPYFHDCVITAERAQVVPLSEAEMIEALEAAGSEPDFFDIGEEVATATSPASLRPYIAKVVFSEHIIDPRISSHGREQERRYALAAATSEEANKIAHKIARLNRPDWEEVHYQVSISEDTTTRSAQAVLLANHISKDTVDLLRRIAEDSEKGNLFDVQAYLERVSGGEDERHAFINETPATQVRHEIEALEAYAGRSAKLSHLLKQVFNVNVADRANPRPVTRADVELGQRRGLQVYLESGTFHWALPGSRESSKVYGDIAKSEDEAYALGGRRFASPASLKPYLIDVEFHSEMAEGNNDPYAEATYAVAAGSIDAARIAAERLAMESSYSDSRVHPWLSMIVTGLDKDCDLPVDDEYELGILVMDHLGEATRLFFELEIANEEHSGDRPATIDSAYTSLLQMDAETLRGLTPKMRSLNPNRMVMLAEIEALIALGQRQAPLNRYTNKL